MCNKCLGLIHRLNTYMAYSRGAGARESAILVFAHNRREAKAIAWYPASEFVEEYIDLAINRLHEPQLYENANAEKLAQGIPHVIDSPRSCKDCEMWGYHLNDDGICEDCEQDIEDQRVTNEQE